MLILLPPSEGKSRPVDGPLLDLEQLSMPALDKSRQRVLSALIKLCQGRPIRARTVLGLSTGQDAEIELNALLETAPTAAAADVYSGVVYEYLGYRTMSATRRRRLDRWIVVSSALWGSVRLTDNIPSYRLSGAVTLPRIGPLGQFWRKPLGHVLPEMSDGGPILDLRSGTYAKMWTPHADLAPHMAVGRVLQEMPDGSTKVVSHHNKATKGRLVRDLSRISRAPASVAELADVIESLGYHVGVRHPAGAKPAQLDIIVRDL
ncbi:MAG TPA: peroxide stress protein YaaA [Actinomycetes bacterium]|nr:peroxide stress protein YaaA [Actinomycetes bacterium]